MGAGEEVGTVADPAVVELSGIAASRAHPGVLWVHNDSGGVPVVYALSSTGEALGAYAVDGAEAVDWEDIGIGPGPEAGRSYLYLADIGDNGSAREHVTVYRVAEPDAAPNGTAATLPLVDALTIRYPDGPSDAESLFVDPLDGDLYVITKNLSGRSRVLRASADGGRGGRRHHDGGRGRLPGRRPRGHRGRAGPPGHDGDRRRHLARRLDRPGPDLPGGAGVRATGGPPVGGGVRVAALFGAVARRAAGRGHRVQRRRRLLHHDQRGRRASGAPLPGRPAAGHDHHHDRAGHHAPVPDAEPRQTRTRARAGSRSCS